MRERENQQMRGDGEGRVFVLPKPGGSPHYCLQQRTPEREEEWKNMEWVVGAEKYKASEGSFLLSRSTLLLTFNFRSLAKTTQRQTQTLFHSIIDDVFVVFLNVQSKLKSVGWGIWLMQVTVAVEGGAVEVEALVALGFCVLPARVTQAN